MTERVICCPLSGVIEGALVQREIKESLLVREREKERKKADTRDPVHVQLMFLYITLT